jgi:hypothetical protein
MRDSGHHLGMHVNTLRLTMMGTDSRDATGDGATDTRRPSPTSVLLIVLAVLGIVVTFAFGMWMIGFAQHTASPFLDVPPAG